MMICYDDMLWYSSRDHRNQKICLFLLLFLLFREKLMVPSFYFKRLFRIVFFAEQPWFSHNLPLTSLSSLPCHLLRGVTVLNLDALFLPRNTKNIDVSKEEESFISEDGLDISRERKLSKKNAPMQPKPPTPIPPTSGPLDVFKKVRTAYTMAVFIIDVSPNIFTNTVINHIIVSQISIHPPLFHSLIHFLFRRNPNIPTEL